MHCRVGVVSHRHHVATGKVWREGRTKIVTDGITRRACFATIVHLAGRLFWRKLEESGTNSILLTSLYVFSSSEFVPLVIVLFGIHVERLPNVVMA